MNYYIYEKWQNGNRVLAKKANNEKDAITIGGKLFTDWKIIGARIDSVEVRYNPSNALVWKFTN